MKLAHAPQETSIPTPLEIHVGVTLTESSAASAEQWRKAECGEAVELVERVGFMSLEGLAAFARESAVPARVYVHPPFLPETVAAETGWPLGVIVPTKRPAARATGTKLIETAGW